MTEGRIPQEAGDDLRGGSKSIFISYRRAGTSGYGGRLQDDLRDRFGTDRVFRDIDSIRPGADFAQVISEAVASAGVVLALIGREWLTVTDEAGNRRIDHPDDFVRIEIQSALDQGLVLIPVLVEGARVPSSSALPAPLARLGRIQGIELTDERWDYDLGRLVRWLEEVLDEPAGAIADAPEPAAAAVDTPTRLRPAPEARRPPMPHAEAEAGRAPVEVPGGRSDRWMGRLGAGAVLTSTLRATRRHRAIALLAGVLLVGGAASALLLGQNDEVGDIALGSGGGQTSIVTAVPVTTSGPTAGGPAPTRATTAPPRTTTTRLVTTTVATPGPPELVSITGNVRTGRVTVRFSRKVVAGGGSLTTMRLIVYGSDPACRTPAGNAQAFLSGLGTDTVTASATSLVAGKTFVSIGDGFVKNAQDGTPNPAVGCMPIPVAA